MPTYYRFQNEVPRHSEIVHCFTNFKDFKGFVQMMKAEDPDFYRMRFWEIEGQFVKDDEGDALVQVFSAREIKM